VRLRSEAFAVVGFALALRATALTRAESATFAVIVAEDVPLSDISLDELSRVFALKRAFWRPGKGIHVVLPGTGQPARDFLLVRVCHKTEGELRRLVLESTYRGEIDQPPKVANSEEEALKLVSSLASSVALVASEARLPPGVKVLHVDGKLPADPGYPLTR
jgi:hypothetical protein